ncbi:ras-related protein Rab-37 isoform X1 [Corvus kubaryi]|uniref:ras-related protein Rab-37 isoform X1 n=2 Tax=Corvus kubaryi TaxID=68294 RepID=UPI001C03C627|nr:ras-related protein Rab-37 isoform X1 [Corvus kubaryi]
MCGGSARRAPGKPRVPGVGVQWGRFPLFSLFFLIPCPGWAGRRPAHGLGGGIGRGGRRRKRRRKAGGAASPAGPAAPGLGGSARTHHGRPRWGGGERDPPGGERGTPEGRQGPPGAAPGLRTVRQGGRRRGVMLLGDSGVGKTCFLLQFKDGAFLSGTFIATVGIDFRNKVVAVDGVKVKLQIWDTAGQERFRSVTHAYYRDAQALLLLYDITSKMSFDNIRAWLTEIHEYAQKDVVIMLLGNKADVSSERAVRTEDGASLAREYGVPFMETSAKTGMNVELAFLAIAKELKQRAVQPLDEPCFQIHDYIESQKKKSSCCAFS